MAMINLALAGQGRKEIAQALDITPEGVGTIMRSPVFQDELARRREELNKEVNQRLATIPEQAKKELEDAALTAARTHIDLLNPDTCPDPKVRQASANAILDRVLEKNQAQAGQVILLSAESVQLIQLALKECGGPPSEAMELVSPEPSPAPATTPA
jgi:hypothetical protein